MKGYITMFNREEQMIRLQQRETLIECIDCLLKMPKERFYSEDFERLGNIVTTKSEGKPHDIPYAYQIAITLGELSEIPGSEFSEDQLVQLDRIYGEKDREKEESKDRYVSRIGARGNGLYGVFDRNESTDNKIYWVADNLTEYRADEVAKTLNRIEEEKNEG